MSQRRRFSILFCVVLFSSALLHGGSGSVGAAMLEESESLPLPAQRMALTGDSLLLRLPSAQADLQVAETVMQVEGSSRISTGRGRFSSLILRNKSDSFSSGDKTS